MNYSSISDFVIGFSINFIAVLFLFSILRKGTKHAVVYALSVIVSFCVYYFSVKLTNRPSYMEDIGAMVLIVSIFLGLFFGTICYMLCEKLNKGKFGPQQNHAE